jgi:hypothetical protein
MPELTPTAVKNILRDCFYKPEEIPDPTKAPPGAVLVEGLTMNFGLHPDRLESHRDEVKALLAENRIAWGALPGGLSNVKVL